MRPEEFEAARLLSDNDDLSVFDKEQMLSHLLESEGIDASEPDGARQSRRVRRRRSRQWFHASWLATGFAAAAAAFLIVREPVTPGQTLTPPSNTTDGFTARSGALGAALEVACDPGPTCEAGSVLTFRVMGALTGPSYVAAYATRHDGAVIWYLPRPGNETAVLVATEEWLPAGVRLGDEHTPGEYVIHVFVGARPFTRDEVKRFVELGAVDSMVELQHTLTIHAAQDRARPTDDLEPAR